MPNELNKQRSADAVQSGIQFKICLRFTFSEPNRTSYEFKMHLIL